MPHTACALGSDERAVIYLRRGRPYRHISITSKGLDPKYFENLFVPYSTKHISFIQIGKHPHKSSIFVTNSHRRELHPSLLANHYFRVLEGQGVFGSQSLIVHNEGNSFGKGVRCRRQRELIRRCDSVMFDRVVERIHRNSVHTAKRTLVTLDDTVWDRLQVERTNVRKGDRSCIFMREQPKSSSPDHSARSLLI